MSYPKNLSYKINRLGNGLFQKQTLKILPDNTKATPSNTISFKLPPNSLLDIRSFCMFMTGSTVSLGKKGADFQSCFFPRNTSSLIEQLSISINGYQIENIQNYNQLYNILSDWQASGENEVKSFLKLTDPSHYQVMNDAGVITLHETLVSDTTDKHHNQKKMVISDWIGFLGSSSGEYLDTNLVGEVIITIRFSPANILWKSPTPAGGAVDTNVKDATYTLDNIYATISRVQMDPLYYELMSSAVINSGIEIGYTTFSTHVGTKQSTKTQTFSFNTSGSCIRYVIGTLLINDYQTISPLQTGGHYLSLTGDIDRFNQSNYFRKDGRNIDTSAFEINNQQTTPYALPLEEIYINNELAFNSLQDVVGGHHTGLNSLEAFAKYYFCHVQSLEFRGSDGFTMSGLDTKNASANIVFKTVLKSGSTDASVYPLCFCAKDQILQIGAGRQVNVVM